MIIFEKEYDGESLYDLDRDVSEVFTYDPNSKVATIPSDRYGIHTGTFKVTITWTNETHPENEEPKSDIKPKIPARTIEEIARKLFGEMGEEDKQLLKTMARDDMIQFHHTNGMAIRNKYQLWEPHNPLTAQWHKDCQEKFEKYMDNGVDCHPQHPDHISMEILYKIWDIVHG